MTLEPLDERAFLRYLQAYSQPMAELSLLWMGKRLLWCIAFSPGGSNGRMPCLDGMGV